MIKTIKKFIFVLITSATLIFSFINPIEAKADTLKIGAAPMVFYGDKSKMQKGQIKEFTLKVANTSEFAKSQGQTGINNFTYKVHINPTERNSNKYNNIPEDQKTLVMASKWVTIENNDFILKPGTEETIKFLVKVPEKANIGEYLAVLNVEEAPNNKNNKKNVNININSALQVPLFIDVEDAHNKLRSNYKIQGFSVSDSLKSTSLLKTLEGLMPFTHNWINNWEDLSSKPYKFSFSFLGKQHIIYDIPKINKSYLGDLITNDKSKLSNTRYIYANEDLPKSDLLERIEFQANKLILIDATNGKSYVLTTPSAEFCDNIKNQINQFATTLNTKPTIGSILDNVMLYSSKEETQNILYLNYKIKNTGNKTIVPNGTILIKNGNAVIETLPYSSSVIMPGKTKNIIGELDYSQDSFSSGNNTFHIQSTILPFTNAKSIQENNSIELLHIRIYIYIGFVVLILLILLLITLGIRRFLKKRVTTKNSKKIEV
ncbi:MAG: hypothetical protein PHX70_07870 [Clostridium sp.]|nr:hypothetical protein [Clostridium sp.]